MYSEITASQTYFFDVFVVLQTVQSRYTIWKRHSSDYATAYQHITSLPIKAKSQTLALGPACGKCVLAESTRSRG